MLSDNLGHGVWGQLRKFRRNFFLPRGLGMTWHLPCRADAPLKNIVTLQKQLAAAKAELVAARIEIQTLRMQLKNAEMLYQFELQKSSNKKAHEKRAERN